jgi:hypothetical protein
MADRTNLTNNREPFVTDGARFCEIELTNVLKWEQSHGKAQVVNQSEMEREAPDLQSPLQLPL